MENDFEKVNIADAFNFPIPANKKVADEEKTPHTEKVRGARTGKPVKLLKMSPTLTSDDEEWDRLAEIEFMKNRREAARVKWYESLPEKFKKPLDEKVDEAVSDRIQRLKNGSTHQLSLLCIGPYGSGKTWVAYTYMRLAVENNLLWPQEILHGTESSIFEPLFLVPRWEQSAKLKEILNDRYRMILIDDVGMLSRWPDEQTRTSLYSSIVNWAWENNKALILTTNLPPGADRDLNNWVGNRAYERIRNMVGGDVVFRLENKRPEMQARWEKEYQESLRKQEV